MAVTYPYIQEVYAFLTNSPRKLLGVIDYCTNHYKSAYMKMHEYDTICGNRNCRIGYFEHKYGDMYFDGTETIMNFILVEDIQRNKDGSHKPRFIWKLPKRGKWYLCSKCKMVYYCSKRCQKKSWNKQHRYHCKKLSQ
eukprot:332810_1